MGREEAAVSPELLEVIDNNWRILAPHIAQAILTLVRSSQLNEGAAALPKADESMVVP